MTANHGCTSSPSQAITNMWHNRHVPTQACHFQHHGIHARYCNPIHYFVLNHGFNRSVDDIESTHHPTHDMHH